MTYQEIEKMYTRIFSENELQEIRHQIHMYPELGGEEFHTDEVICSSLEKWGIPYKKGLAGTGVAVRFTGKRPGKTVALRADIDALPVQEETGLPFSSKVPGKMHACGHDIHTTVLIGIARMLKELDGEYAGNFTLIFQPAEERQGGAKPMIEAGVLEDPHADCCLALHCGADIDAGYTGIRYDSMFAASDAIDIKITGKSSHAAYPSLGVDPIVIAAQIISTIQSVISRNTAPQNSAVVTIGKISGGTVRNQIPDTVEMQGTIRTLDPETREFTVKRVEDICRGIAESMGGKAEFTRKAGYPPLVNDNSIVDVMKQVMTEGIGAENVHILKAPVMGAEDFAYFTQERPSALWRLGCRHKGAETVPLHNSKFDPDESCIDLGVKLQTAIALRLAGNE